MENNCGEIVFEDVDNLKSHPKNNNIHSIEQIERLAHIINSQGFRNPIIVSKESGYVVAGHARLQAVRLLNWKTVPVMYQSFKDEQYEYAFLTADNTIHSWSIFNDSLFKEEVSIFEKNFDFDLFGLKSLQDKDVLSELPDISPKDPDIVKVTVTLSCEQKDIYDEAIRISKKNFDCIDEINSNANGNALIEILRKYVCGQF